MKKYFIIFLLIGTNFILFSNDNLILNPRKKYPFGTNVGLLGPSGHLSVAVNAFVVPKINVELGAGVFNFNNSFIPSSFLGVKYHFGGNFISRATFYLGVYDAMSFDFQNHNLYFPLGINRIKKNHLTWSVEIAFQPTKVYYNSTLWGAFKVGYQFGFNKKQKKNFFNKKS